MCKLGVGLPHFATLGSAVRTSNLCWLKPLHHAKSTTLTHTHARTHTRWHKLLTGALSHWKVDQQHTHIQTFTHVYLRLTCPAATESSLLWKSIFCIPDMSPKTCCLPFSAVGAVLPGPRCGKLSIGPSNLALKALSEHVRTSLSRVCDSLSCYPGASTKLSVDIRG